MSGTFGASLPRRLSGAGQVILAVVMALVLFPAGLQAVRAGELPGVWSTAVVVALVTLHVAVGTARRGPVVSFGAGAVACLVLVTAPDVVGDTAIVNAKDYGPILLPSTLCFFPLLYAVSAHARAPWPNLALGTGLVGCGAAVARLWGFQGVPITAWAWWLMLSTTALGGTIAAWALGRYRVTRAAWGAQLVERSAADERRRIAREMHDVVAHSLAVVVSHAEAGRLVVPRSPERAPEIFDTIAEVGREALVEMRGLLGVLRDDDVPNEPMPGLADLPALIERTRAMGTAVEFTADDTQRVTPAVGLTVYRVVQEALTNIVRHAEPGSAAQVTVASSGRDIAVTVTNTGVHTQLQPQPGRGLWGMRERVEAVGGTFEAGPDGNGWRVGARIGL